MLWQENQTQTSAAEFKAKLPQDNYLQALC